MRDKLLQLRGKFLTLLTVLFFSTNIFAQLEDGSFSYQITDWDNFEVSVERCLDEEAEELTIPATIEYGGYTYSVTGILYFGFGEHYSLRSIEIPKSVTSIEFYAFYDCNSLTEVTVNWEEPLAGIGEDVFEGINLSLVKLNVPKGTERAYAEDDFWGNFYVENAYKNNKIYYTSNTGEVVEPHKSDAFGEVKIISNTYNEEEGQGVIVFNKDIAVIGESAFSDCGNLASIEIPEGVTSIGESAFLECGNLTSIKIPESVTSIGDWAFNGCTSLKFVEIPESVTSIGDGTFGGCTSLKFVEIPESVTSIGDGTFEGCESLSAIEIPENVTSIGSRAFAGCIGLMTIQIPNSVEEIRAEAFEECSNLLSVKIGEGVKYIRYRAFAGCSSLTSITIPKSVVFIMEHAFDGSGLTSITLEEGIGNVFEMSSFAGCANLKSITIPESVTCIGDDTYGYLAGGIRDGVFAGSSLTTINIPKTITRLGVWAFYGCNKLTEVTVNWDEPLTDVDKEAFKGIDLSSVKLIVPKGTEKTYAEAPVWKDFYIEGMHENYRIYYISSDGKEVIPNINPEYIISNTCNSGGQGVIVFNSDLEEIGGFSGCTNLTSIKIPESVTLIGEGAFEGCTGLSSIEIPESVTKIDGDAFNGCTGLNSIKVEWAKPIEISADCFGNLTLSNIMLYVPEGTINEYKSAEVWKNFKYQTSSKTYGEPSFAWSEDKTYSTATFTCNEDLSTIVEICKIESTTTPSTCSEAGKIVYVAKVNFGGKDYTSDPEEVTLPLAAHVWNAPEFVWSTNKSSAKANFVCETNDEHTEELSCQVDSVIIGATTEKEGSKIYTATVVFDGKLFSDKQTDILPISGKTYGEPSFAWSEDKTYSTATFTCNEDLSTIVEICKVESTTTPSTCSEAGKIVFVAKVNFGGKDYTSEPEEVTLPLAAHVWKAPEFVWSANKSSANANFVCETNDEHTEELSCQVDSVIIGATTEKAGSKIYTATVVFNGELFSDKQTDILPISGKTYGEPSFAWSEDKTYSTATFTCNEDLSTIVEICKVESTTTPSTCSEAGKIVYVAKVNFGGNDYTSAPEEVVLPLAAHVWKAPEFVWSANKSSANANFVCANNEEHKEELSCQVDSVIIGATTEKTGSKIYTATVVFNGELFSDKQTTILPISGKTYGEPSFAWSEDKTYSTATFTCNEDLSTIVEICKIESTTTPSTCSEAGKIVYVAKVNFGGKDYTSAPEEVVLPLAAHVWKAPEFVWSANKSSANANFVCANNEEHKEELDCQVDSVIIEATTEKEGSKIYTATVVFNGETYTDTKDEILEKLPSTAVDDVETNQVKVWGYNRVVYIENAEGLAQVFDATGRLVKSIEIYDAHSEIPMDRSGVYIVVVEGKSYKICN